MDLLWCPIVAALAASLCCTPAVADHKFGCLFEDKLCTPYEFCVNDGVLGRCQELAGADLYTHEISPSALQRLKILLQKLAHRGFTWQDDITQQVISRELSKLRNVPLRHKPAASSPLTSYSSSRDRKLRPVQAGLSRSLQQYLTNLGFLPHAAVNGQPGVQPERASTQNGDGPLESKQPKPQQGWKETTIYSLQKGADQPPVTKVLTQSGEGRHPKLSTTFSNWDLARGKLLSSHLEQLLAGASGTPQNTPGGQAVWPEGKLHYLSSIQPAQSDHSELQPQVAFGSRTQKPNLNRLPFKANSNRLTAEEPLNIMDERFIQNVVNQLGRHSISMGALMGKDQDHVAKVITGSLQKVDEERPAVGAQPGPGSADSRGGMEGNKEPLAGMQLNHQLELKLDKEQDQNQKDTVRMKQQGQQVEGADKEPVDKHAAFFSKLLDYLNMEPFDDTPGVNTGPPAPLQKTIGLESVHSRTTQGQVPLPHRWEEKTMAVPAKEGSILRLTGNAEGPNAQVDSEIDRWMQGIQTPAAKQQVEEPEKKDMKIKTQLVHVGMKEFSSRGKDRHFGYIITSSDSLTSDQGLALMEHLTQRLNLHATYLTQLSVLGPALTFRVGPNPKNVTNADLVQVAVQQKQQLEKETGLKIVEAGVSDGALMLL
uniref:receptor-type tyrosine-protein phosphatase N2-like n=1 Tax=Monopterus albus TaxID=43700 RepID=UPI0009B3C07F|nr:receptor-type tyrosine-protein phosphatase N2-like [Monopterus albus]